MKNSRRLVRLVMKLRMEGAMLELGWNKEKFTRRIAKLEARWGHHREVMVSFRSILGREATRVWNEGMEKVQKKVNHLRRKWGSGERQVEDSVWRGVRIGDRELQDELQVQQQEVVPHRYGGILTTKEEDTITTLPHKFTTYEKIDIDKIKVSTEIMKDNIRWEVRERDGREGAARTEDWEFLQQEEKEVYRPAENKLDFQRRRVTNMPTNRFINISDPVAQGIKTVLDNISHRVIGAAQQYIKNKCKIRAIFESRTSHQSRSMV